MVRVQAPALSLEASGSLAGALVFSKWKGRPYVRTLVKPANPRSGGQVGMRACLKFLSQDWANVPSADQASWKKRADQAVISEFNAYIGFNQFRWRDFLAPCQMDPPAATDVPSTLGTLAAVPGVRSITITQPVTTASDGWAVALFRGLVTSFGSAFDNLIQILPIDATNDVVFVDSPLDPDEYFYVARSITLDGQLSTEGNEASAEVT